MNEEISAAIQELFAQLRGECVVVMDLSWYRRLAKPFRNEEDDRDPEEIQPDSGDRLLGYPIDVRDNGGKPHIEWRVK